MLIVLLLTMNLRQYFRLENSLIRYSKHLTNTNKKQNSPFLNLDVKLVSTLREKGMKEQNINVNLIQILFMIMEMF